ncbi:MAG TPA: 4-hydroxy-tetrahydrodipicolinate reductase [Rhodothermales bacterium]|nr:4-hydroxy-tetrahydrodipicolinate reductase [Rhodothermales bacterium]HRR09029.1 4-hydroxy-tetrahydrodipicolinate reductase [Rhodothermales bacterium]
MKIALNGASGRMGQAIALLLKEGGSHDLVACFDVETSLLTEHEMEVMNEADVVIDFSHPAVVMDHIHRYCLWGFNAVIGTTGWYKEMEKVKDWVEEGQIGLLYAPNFSMGVALLVKALNAVLPTLEHLNEFDAYVHEWHHIGKVDSPSGTALKLAQTILEGLSRKTHLSTEAQHGTIASSALHVTSTRVGHVFGEHYVGFDSPYEQLLFRHEAKSRAVFASGAIRAAEWLQGKSGLFTLQDVLGD